MQILILVHRDSQQGANFPVRSGVMLSQETKKEQPGAQLTFSHFSNFIFKKKTNDKTQYVHLNDNSKQEITLPA